MKVAYICPSCRATINAPASLQGESSSCPKCNADVDRWPAPVSSPGTVRVVPPPSEPAVWHYSVNGARRGPVTFGQLKSLVEGAALRPNDLIWREGLPAWVEAGTVPELFPVMLVKAAPPPVPVPAARPVARPAPQPEEESDDEDRRSRRDDRQQILVNVQQVIEREDEPRPRRRRGYRCPFCDSPARPVIRQQVSPAGWVVFVLLLIFTIIFCFIGLLMTEEVRSCPECGARV